MTLCVAILNVAWCMVYYASVLPTGDSFSNLIIFQVNPRNLFTNIPKSTFGSRQEEQSWGVHLNRKKIKTYNFPVVKYSLSHLVSNFVGVNYIIIITKTWLLSHIISQHPDFNLIYVKSIEIDAGDTV